MPSHDFKKIIGPKGATPAKKIANTNNNTKVQSLFNNNKTDTQHFAILNHSYFVCQLFLDKSPAS